MGLNTERLFRNIPGRLVSRRLCGYPILYMNAKFTERNHAFLKHRAIELPQIEMIAELALRFLPQGLDLQASRVVGGKLAGNTAIRSTASAADFAVKCP